MSVSLDELSDRIRGVIEDHFNLTPDYPEGLEASLVSELGWERSGTPVEELIQEIASIDESIARDVKEHLSEQFGYRAVRDGEENPYGDEAHYEDEGPDDSGFWESWDAFCTHVRFRSRFFSPHARQA
jgi:hypothetical protein